MQSRIKQERVAKNLSQEGLAMLLGVSKSTITRWEKNASCVKQGDLIRMGKLFGCSINWLVGESDTRKAPKRVSAVRKEGVW